MKRPLAGSLAILALVLAGTAAKGSVTASPSSVSVFPTETSAPITVSLTFIGGAPDPGTFNLDISFPPALAGNTTTLPSPVTYPGGSLSVMTSFRFVTSSATPLGSHVVTITDLASLAGSTTVTLVVQQPLFTATAIPNPLELAIGGTPQTVTVSTTTDPGFSGIISYSFVGFPAFINTGGPRTSSGQPVLFPFSLGPGAVTGIFSGFLRGVASPTGAGMQTREFPFTVIIGVPRPVITEVIPPSVAAGSLSTRTTLVGENFETGAIVSSASPFVTVEDTRVVSPTLAEVRLSVASGAPPGPFQLDLANPNGATTREGGRMVVFASDSVAAPLAVTTVAVVSPRPGSQLADGEAVYARGLLATTGAGLVVGSWLFDGVPFDSFAVSVHGGNPVSVSSHVPIPTSFRGRHRVQLAIQHPQSVVSPALLIVQTTRRATALRILAPAKEIAVGRTAPQFRWSLVPGASGYEIQIERAPPELPLSYRLSRAEWTPTELEIGQIGVGRRRWRVRPVLPGEVYGQATAWQELILLPGSVELAMAPPARDPETGRLLLEWSGGSAGMIYLVEFLRVESLEVAFSALTSNQSYLLPPGNPYRFPTYRVRVTAYGPEGESLGVSEPVELSGELLQPRGRVLLAQVQALPQIELRAPTEGGVVESERPLIEASWSGSVPVEEVFLIVDSTDVTDLAEISATSVTYVPVLPLSRGSHMVEVSLANRVTGWTFTIELPGGAAPEAAEEGTELVHPPSVVPPGLREVRQEWAVDTEGTVTAFGGDSPTEPDEARVMISGQGDLTSGPFLVKGTADASWSRLLEGESSTVQESENWLLELGAQQLRTREGAIGGYAAPSFQDQTEFLNAGFIRGGVEVRAGSTQLTAAFYDTFDAALGSVASADLGSEQELRSAALEAGDGVDRLLRVVAFEVEQQGDFFTPGGEGSVAGLFGLYAFRSGLTVVFEGAQSDFDPDPESFELPKKGNAFRIGVSGTRGTLKYALNLRHVDEDFVNLANPGLTSGGRADRDSIDLALTKGFGRSKFSLELQHLDGGDSFGPPARQTAGTLTFSSSVSPGIQLRLSGNLTTTRGDAVEELFIPETDRSDWGASLTADELMGKFQLSQSLSFQSKEDELNPSADTETTNANVSAYGSLTTHFNFSASFNGTRVEADPRVGTTDTMVLSLQPLLEIPSAWMSLQPAAYYTNITNDVLDFDTTDELYQVRLSLTPPWQNSLLALEVTADWSRTRDRQSLIEADFVERYTAALTIRWGGSGTSEAVGAPASSASHPLRAGGPSVATVLARAFPPVPRL